tara:strand:+ start:1713 stop:2294 length:582 start_codon:yes stop_codon:yes gene_type:complete
MEAYLQMMRHVIVRTQGAEKGLNIVNTFVIPDVVQEYINTRRDVVSNVHCRAQDTIQQHLSWHMYLTGVIHDTPIVDSVAWELLYDYLNEVLNIPYEAVHCLEMSMNSDPARPHVLIRGFKDVFVGDYTTPEYVALAHALDKDITELKPPALSITPEEMSHLDNALKQALGDNAPDTFDIITSIPTGQDVFLA